MATKGNTAGLENDLGDISYYIDNYQKQASHGHNEKASDMMIEFLGIDNAEILKDLIVTFPNPRFGREPMAVPTMLGEMDMPGKVTSQGNEGPIAFLNVIAESDVEKLLYGFFETNARLKLRLYKRGEMNQKTKKGWTLFDAWFEIDNGEKQKSEGTPYRIEGNVHWAYALPNDKVT